MNIPRFGDLQANDPFFDREDHATFTSSKVINSRYDKERQRIRDKFLALHDILYPEMKREGLDLHPHWHPPNIVSTWYIGRIEQIWFMKLRYLRSRAEVQVVEEKMGVPKLLDYSETQYTKHPMMDIRIDSEYLAVELLLTDKAWLDAQNFKSKVEKHKTERQHLVRILQDLGHDYIFGRWPDTSKPDLIKTTADLANEERLLDWLSRFDPGYSWLRLGIWYTEYEDSRLTTGRIVEEVLYRFKQLYPVYQFLLWTPNNNFR
ncbi:MAG: hypothetical protein JXA33_07250 [Anaerolineae bacterium]|nr:hypothetical protein [Anaerolineae bacterium]